MTNLFQGNYEISEFILDHTTGIIIQNKNNFNYNDLITKFSASESDDPSTAPVHFNILNIQIIDCAAEVSIKNRKYQLKLWEGIVLPAHSPHKFNAYEQFKITTTVIKSGYEE